MVQVRRTGSSYPATSRSPVRYNSSATEASICYRRKICRIMEEIYQLVKPSTRKLPGRLVAAANNLGQLVYEIAFKGKLRSFVGMRAYPKANDPPFLPA